MNKNLKTIKIKDLLFVILYSSVLPILLGALLGFIDYYLQTMLSFTFAYMLYWFIAIYIGKTVRKQYDNPHIVYTIIAGIGMLCAWTVLITLPYVYAQALYLGEPTLVFSPSIYLYAFLDFFNPLIWIQYFSLDLMIQLLILGVGTYLGIKRTLI